MTDTAPERSARPPEARLLLAPGCAHCPAVLDGLSRLVKEGRLARLEVINIAAHPEAAEAEGVRSVPWFTIGPFRLSGLHSPAELAEWTERAAGGSGISSYYGHLLETNRLADVVGLVTESPGSLADLLFLIGEPDTPMAVRIGIGAVVEELAGSPVLAGAVDTLAALTRSENVQVRADACHYLGLTGSPEAIPVLTERLDDDSDEVREIASESLALLHPRETDAQG